VWLPWWVGALGAAVLAAAHLVLRRRRGRGVATAAAACGEAALVFALYGLWQLGEEVQGLSVSGATGNALRLWHLERWLHLPDERAWVRVAASHPTLADGLSAYYGGLHVPAIILLLLWCFFRRREAYGRTRNALAGATALSLVAHLVPLAPPRLLPQLGFVDVAALRHLSVYGAIGTGLSDQVAAMPSVHVAGAALVGATAVQASRSRWRWLVLAHPVLTVVAVTATANHWWLDGVAGAWLVALCWLADDRARSWVRQRRARRPSHARNTAGTSPQHADSSLSPT
jgi:hypothetical protein